MGGRGYRWRAGVHRPARTLFRLHYCDEAFADSLQRWFLLGRGPDVPAPHGYPKARHARRGSLNGCSIAESLEAVTSPQGTCRANSGAVVHGGGPPPALRPVTLHRVNGKPSSHSYCRKLPDFLPQSRERIRTDLRSIDIPPSRSVIGSSSLARAVRLSKLIECLHTRINASKPVSAVEFRSIEPPGPAPACVNSLTHAPRAHSPDMSLYFGSARQPPEDPAAATAFLVFCTRPWGLDHIGNFAVR